MKEAWEQHQSQPQLMPTAFCSWEKQEPGSQEREGCVMGAQWGAWVGSGSELAELVHIPSSLACLWMGVLSN